MQAVSLLPTVVPNQWHDYKNCLTPEHAGSASPINAYCASATCSDLASLMQTDTTPLNGTIAIVTVDSRKDHPTMEAWRAYAKLHGYEYIQVQATATEEDIKQVDDVHMLFDWRSTKNILDVLKDPQYAHVQYVMYTELDQWIVTPLKTRLEPLIVAHGLDTGANVMAITEEYPCRDARGGGVFNVGTFLVSRSSETEALLTAWYGSNMHGGEHHSVWPARQGAFSHDPSVYNKFKDLISIIPSACPLGSPYGLALSHMTGGDIVGAFTADAGRDVFETLVLPCVQDALAAGVDHTCAMHPLWAGGTCLMCKQTYQIERNGTIYEAEAETCCGENDAALLTHKFRELAGLFEAREPEVILDALKTVYEGRAPLELYALVGLKERNQAEEEVDVDHEFTEQFAASISAQLAQDNITLPSPPPLPPPSAPPPLPTLCDSPGCTQAATWEGPRSLVYVAHLSTAETSVTEVFRHLHLQTGMPYAWGGKHAGWLDDARRRGFQCEANPLDTDSPKASSSAQCLCFLEYAFKYGITTEGLWLCPDTLAPKYNNMLRQVMPDAKWFSTVRDPWTHMLATFRRVQAPGMDWKKHEPMTADTCEYAGDTYRYRLSAECFPPLFIDPQLRKCLNEDRTMLFSQMCAIGFDDAPTPASLESSYDLLLAAENPVTPLLAALHFDWGVSRDVIQRVHSGLQTDCSSGNTFGVDTLGYDESTKWNASTLDQQSNFSTWSADAYAIYQHSVERSQELAQRYLTEMDQSDSVCWDSLFYFAPTTAPTAVVRPIELAKRWTTFDNANWRFSDTRLDSCMAGMPDNVNRASIADPGAPAATRVEANGLLSTWTSISRDASPQCFNSTGYPSDLSGPHYADAIVAPAFKLAFQTVAKVGSMTATKWMQCRFGAEFMKPSYPDYTRLVMLREPMSRTFAGFNQVSSHYLALFRLPPSNISLCADAWPEGLDDIVNDPSIFFENSTWPQICRDAWTLSITHGKLDTRVERHHGVDTNVTNMTKIQLTKEILLTTKDSSLYNALWELPDGCRQVGRTVFSTTNPVTGAVEAGTTWFCEGDQCRDECTLTEHQLATLFSKALSDAAKQNQLGCGSPMFGNEHMWPQVLHTHRAGRADAVIRLEHVDEDEPRFEKLLAARLGRALPPVQENCSLSSIHNGASDTLVEPAISNNTGLASIMSRSPTMQRRVCALYYHDFVCGGYELPPACKEPTELWLADTISDLMNDAPVPPFGSTGELGSGEGGENEGSDQTVSTAALDESRAYFETLMAQQVRVSKRVQPLAYSAELLQQFF